MYFSTRRRRHFCAEDIGREAGQSLGEYSLILGLVVFAAVAAVTVLGTTLLDLYQKIVAVF